MYTNIDYCAHNVCPMWFAEYIRTYMKRKNKSESRAIVLQLAS